MASATVRVRPLRLAFLVEPNDKRGLQRIFETNSALWGGLFNFIVPVFKSVPARYREEHFRTVPAIEMLKGLVEGFQPDYLVELTRGSSANYGISFPARRILNIDDLTARDDQGRCKIGVDLRSVCDDLYRTTFRFVQTHPPEVVIPSPKEKRFTLFFAATFGFLPETGPLSDVSDIYLKALGGNRAVIKAVEFPSLFNPKSLYPLRATHHELDTFNNSWAIDSKLFYMDEQSSYDLIEFWNLRALGWRIRPLPVSLAEDLIEYCNYFIKSVYRPYPPPSNAYHHATVVCARSQSFAELQEFIKKLTWIPGPNAYIDHRVPRLWEEWGRRADHAEPQTVENAEKAVDAHVIGEALSIRTEPHDFAKDDHFCSLTAACANVLKSFSGGTPIIPWKKDVASTLTRNFGEERTWVSREGIALLAGENTFLAHVRVPNPINIFASMAESLGYKLELSSAGRTCEQMLHALGGISGMGIVGKSPDLLKLLDRLAHEDLEVDRESEDGDDAKKKKLRKGFVLLSKVMEVLDRINSGGISTGSNHLAALIRTHVLKLGMALRCPECTHTSWFSLETLKPRMSCTHCLKRFDFPSGSPPSRDQWAYRVIGPFTTGGFAGGAYCVGLALSFLTGQIARTSNWVPSFIMRDAAGKEFEADFGLIAKPSWLSDTSSPYLFIGECKSFNRFEAKDFARAEQTMTLFPGAIVCFCTLRKSLDTDEVRSLTKIVKLGRSRFVKRRKKGITVEKQTNPVLVLTGNELFADRFMGDFFSIYGDKAEYARAVYMRDNMQELCDFTVKTYLGMPTESEEFLEKHRKKAAKIALQALGAP